MIGLNNVDNTSDLNKPISILTQNELDKKAPLHNPVFTGTITVKTLIDSENNTGTSNNILTVSDKNTLIWNNIDNILTKIKKKEIPISNITTRLKLSLIIFDNVNKECQQITLEDLRVLLGI